MHHKELHKAVPDPTLKDENLKDEEEGGLTLRKMMGCLQGFWVKSFLKYGEQAERMSLCAWKDSVSVARVTSVNWLSWGNSWRSRGAREEVEGGGEEEEEEERGGGEWRLGWLRTHLAELVEDGDEGSVVVVPPQHVLTLVLLPDQPEGVMMRWQEGEEERGCKEEWIIGQVLDRMRVREKERTRV